jgi:hypothetical protein
MLRLNADLHEKLQEQQEAILLLQQNNRPSWLFVPNFKNDRF